MALIIQLHDDTAIKEYPVDKASFTIGRDPDCDIFIDDKVVSMEHALIETVEDEKKGKTRIHYIKDLGSTNHTYVNGKKIRRRKLKHNDKIRIGWTYFKFIIEKDRKPEKTLKIHKSWIPGVYYTKE